jgi:hypothetical protein
MAEEPTIILEELRAKLDEAGYGAVVLEDSFRNAGRDRSAAEALDDLLELLREGVVVAMRAHAASIRNLQPQPGPRGRLWEPLPRARSRGAEVDGDVWVLGLELTTADRIEEQATELARLIEQLQFSDADQG